MAPLLELLPPWRNTVTKTTTIYREIPTTDNTKMNIKEVTIAKVVLPKDDSTAKFDSVARLGLGRALAIKNTEPNIAAAMAIRALDKDNEAKKMRMMYLTSWVGSIRALRAAEKQKDRDYYAAQKENNRIHCAAENEKDRIYRAERFKSFTTLANTILAHRTAEKEKDRVYRVERSKCLTTLASTILAHRTAEKEKDRIYDEVEKEKDRVYRVERFRSFITLVNTILAHRTAEKEKDRIYCEAENEKDRVYRAERFKSTTQQLNTPERLATVMGHHTASQVQRAARRTLVAKPVAVLGITTVAFGLAA